MSSKNILVTLLPSTDVDLGRWLLQHYGVAYTEHPHAPIFHILALKLRGEGAEDYPLLVENRTKIPTVPKILAHLDANVTTDRPDLRLMPDKDKEPAIYKEVDELQHYVRYNVGNSVVNWSYFNLLQYKWAVWPSITTGVPWYEKLTCFVAFRVIRWLMYKGLHLDQQVADGALKTIYEGFDRFDGLLQDGRKHLVGDRLTYADLAVSASLAPMILAQGYQGFLPNQAKCPKFMQDVYKELRGRPTGQFVQRIYDQHRPG